MDLRSTLAGNKTALLFQKGATIMKNYKRKPLKKQSIRFADESKRSGYVNTPTSFIRSPHLSLGAKLIYLLFHTYAWEGDRCYPGHKMIAAQLGIKDVRAVRTYLNELKNNLLIDWEGKSELRTNVYEILEIPAVLLADSKLSLKVVNERIDRLKEKHKGKKRGYDRVQKLHPTLGTKNVPVSNTHARNTHSVNFSVSNQQEETSTQPTESFLSAELRSSVGVEEARTSKRLSKKKGASKSSVEYLPITDLEVYELAKKYSIHPEDVREAAQSAIDEFTAGNIIKPLGTFKTTDNYLSYRVSNDYIERLDPMFMHYIERAHPLNKAAQRVFGIESKLKSLKQSKSYQKELLVQLQSGPLDPGKTPMFLQAIPDEERLSVVEDRISEIKMEGKNLFSKYKEAQQCFKDMRQQYPERLKMLLAGEI